MTHNVLNFEFDRLIRCPVCLNQLWQNCSNFDCITKECPIESIKVKVVMEK